MSIATIAAADSISTLSVLVVVWIAIRLFGRKQEIDYDKMSKAFLQAMREFDKEINDAEAVDDYQSHRETKPAGIQ